MILSGKKIQACMGKEIIIYPFDPKRINPNSYNLTLNRELLVYENDLLDMKMCIRDSCKRLVDGRTG